MKRVDYDGVAAIYDQRYENNRFDGTSAALTEFVGSARDIGEVGCGTGHWLAELASPTRVLVGIDLSEGMLRATSQLMVISDAEYEAGRARLERERPTLRADLRTYMTTARVPTA
jgi:SAM-dependent methyltransferase